MAGVTVGLVLVTLDGLAARRRLYPRWLGWVALVAGLGSWGPA